MFLAFVFFRCMYVVCGLWIQIHVCVSPHDRLQHRKVLWVGSFKSHRSDRLHVRAVHRAQLHTGCNNRTRITRRRENVATTRKRKRSHRARVTFPRVFFLLLTCCRSLPRIACVVGRAAPKRLDRICDLGAFGCWSLSFAVRLRVALSVCVYINNDFCAVGLSLIACPTKREQRLWITVVHTECGLVCMCLGEFFRCVLFRISCVCDSESLEQWNSVESVIWIWM